MKLKLISKKPEAENVMSFFFETDNSQFSWKAGQYLRYHLDIDQIDDRGMNRYFTIASPPFQKQVQITTRFASDKSSSFKTELKNLTIGSEIEATGPLGNFVIDDPNLHYVFIAGGIGITPFHSIIRELNHQNLPINITLLYANKTEDLVFKKELEQIASEHPEFKIHYFIGDNKIDGDTIKQLISNLQLPIFYISGPEPMMQSFEKLLGEMGVSEDHIRHDYFPGYEEI